MSQHDITGQQPDDPPIIDPHYLETEIDRKTTASMLGRARAILAQGPVAELIAEEEYPGPPWRWHGAPPTSFTRRDSGVRQ